jgi:hypothetical protein
MKNGLKNIKLVILGIASAAIPILFILQADKINLQKDGLGEEKRKSDSLTAINFKQSELIDFYKTELLKKIPNDSVRNLISFNPTIFLPKQNSPTINSSVDSLKASIDDIKNILSIVKDYIISEKNPSNESLFRLNAISDSLRELRQKLYQITYILENDRQFVDKQLITICNLKNNINGRMSRQQIFDKLDSICNNL